MSHKTAATVAHTIGIDTGKNTPCIVRADIHDLRQRRETVEHPFGTMKARMGATRFLTKTLPKVATEMALGSGL